ncbi:PaaI family thioesterase [Shinella sp. 838]|uniref:PaaI family thioesterase n=2 Tax=unclassified Shinella TaxID=2643062 RepID=UPI0003C52FAB|nr:MULTISPECIES: PaaI family thioesterase [unclassified Shinella]EYR81337.1 putative transmembrane protein [Shinella sp. DD12]MCA0341196.1 PaaI family thioesterase [Pseudomonadota bacterium]MDG4671595.1 PaaI family thioesterase [Shinella sp. 838]TAA63472.1 PaaI family thioesterase [Shinella sp. JR1-6]
MNLTPIMDRDALNRFLETDFPQIHTDGKVFDVTEVRSGTVVMRLDPNERHLRPGGTVSGPTLFALADVAAYCVVLAHIGPVALAVTTSLNINFLRKPEPGPLSCTCRLLKLGKRLAVIEASIFGADGEDLVAHATATYSIPPR